MTFRSLRVRLIATGALALVLTLGLAALGLVALFERHVERRLTAELGRHLDQIVAALDVTPAAEIVVTRTLADPRFQMPLSGLYWQVEDGTFSVRSRSLWDAALTLPADSLADGQIHEHEIEGPGRRRLVAVERRVTLSAQPVPRTPRVTVASDRSEIDLARAAFVGDLVPYIALLGLVLILGGSVQIVLGLRPLAGLRARVAAVRSGQDARLGGDFPEEVAPLARELDALLAARERQIAQAQARAADLAHGLRTPLQVLEGDIDRLRAKGETAAADAIAEVAAGMRRHVERELARTRSGAGRASARAEVAPVVTQIVAVVRRVPATAHLDWTVTVPDGTIARIDADDLTEALGNLIENAARHARKRVTVAAVTTTEAVVVTIADDGPGFPPDKAAAVLERGYRLDQSGPGHGLGLAIVADLAEAWNAEFSLQPGPHGVTARLAIPVAPAPRSATS